MTYPRFRQIASESPGLIFELATQLATRLDRTNRKLGDLAFVDVTGRVAHAIMDLCREPDAMTHPDGMQIKVSRQELSRLVGLLARDGRPRAEGARGSRPRARERQDHRRVQRAARVAEGAHARPLAPPPRYSLRPPFAAPAYLRTPRLSLDLFVGRSDFVRLLLGYPDHRLAASPRATSLSG